MTIGKTRDEILTSLMTNLKANTEVTDLDPGSIARAFCDVLSQSISDLYSDLDLTTTMGFVSTATGSFLDMIGKLLDCTRLTNETDANYRVRITNQVYVNAGANAISIRLKVLSIDGVQDVIMKEFTKGAGSFSIYVITSDVQPSTTLIASVQTIVEQYRAAGVQAEVLAPILIPLQLKVRLLFNSDVSDAEKTTIKQAAKQNLKSYIDNIGLGGTFTLNQVVRTLLDSSTKIGDVDVYMMTVNGVTKFPSNFTVDWNQRIVTDVLDVS